MALNSTLEMVNGTRACARLVTASSRTFRCILQTFQEGFLVHLHRDVRFEIEDILYLSTKLQDLIK